MLLGCALFITMGFNLFAEVKLWGVAREGFRAMRQMPPERRRRTYLMMAATYLGSAGYALFLALAPLVTAACQISVLGAGPSLKTPTGHIPLDRHAWEAARHDHRTCTH